MNPIVHERETRIRVDTKSLADSTRDSVTFSDPSGLPLTTTAVVPPLLLTVTLLSRGVGHVIDQGLACVGAGETRAPCQNSHTGSDLEFCVITNRAWCGR